MPSVRSPVSRRSCFFNALTPSRLMKRRAAARPTGLTAIAATSTEVAIKLRTVCATDSNALRVLSTFKDRLPLYVNAAIDYTCSLLVTEAVQVLQRLRREGVQLDGQGRLRLGGPAADRRAIGLHRSPFALHISRSALRSRSHTFSHRPAAAARQRNDLCC